MRKVYRIMQLVAPCNCLDWGYNIVLVLLVGRVFDEAAGGLSDGCTACWMYSWWAVPSIKLLVASLMKDLLARRAPGELRLRWGCCWWPLIWKNSLLDVSFEGRVFDEAAGGLSDGCAACWMCPWWVRSSIKLLVASLREELLVGCIPGGPCLR